MCSVMSWNIWAADDSLKKLNSSPFNASALISLESAIIPSSSHVLISDLSTQEAPLNGTPLERSENLPHIEHLTSFQDVSLSSDSEDKDQSEKEREASLSINQDPVYAPVLALPPTTELVCKGDNLGALTVKQSQDTKTDKLESGSSPAPAQSLVGSSQSTVPELNKALGEKEKVQEKGTLIIKAEIDLNSINHKDMLSLLSLHHKLGIPLQIDFHRVAEWYLQELFPQVQYLQENVIHYPTGKRLRVLCIDGGGVRGIFAARILEELEKRTGLPTSKLFDVIVATSTGAIIAAGVTIPSDKDASQPKFTAHDIVDLYMNKSKSIFGTLLQYRIFGYYGAKYDAAPLMALLKEKFQDKTLKNLIGDVSFTAYNLIKKTGHVFSADEARRSAHENEFIYNVMRATTAAPTIFDPVQLGQNILCDGGVFLNNPVMLGILKGIKNYNRSLHEMDIVSIGTGYAHEFQPLDVYNSYSKINWVEELLNAFLNGNSQHFLAEDLLRAAGHHNGSGVTYKRFTVGLKKENLDIDNCSESNLKALVSLAEDVIKVSDSDIEKLCKILTPLDGKSDEKVS